MMSITRWDPFRDMMSLREAMANLLGRFVRRAARRMQEGAVGTLAVNIKETPDAFVVTAALPGVKPEDVDISVLGETLRIQAETKEEREQTAGTATAEWPLDRPRAAARHGAARSDAACSGEGR